MFTNFTSESVAAGHPDKICDQISDAIVDAAVCVDSHSRIAVETLVTHNRIVLAGEVTCPRSLDYKEIASQVIRDLGYTNADWGFCDKSPISVYIYQQSPDIALGVDDGGAGDQGIMFGYACRHTPELMPLPISLAHRLAEAMDQARIKKALPYLRPDGKVEVTIDYKDGKPDSLNTIILAVPHDQKITNQQLTHDLADKVVGPVIEECPIKTDAYKIIINGTGKWEIGGPASDTGVTGRKIIVDTYGGWARHGGGCFSGKDPTKVDRSAAYAARYLAKNIVAHGLAEVCEVRVAYVIGQAEPVAIDFETFGSKSKSHKLIRSFAHKLLDMKLLSILEKLDLRRPIYYQTAAYGHFGHAEYPWEQIALV